MTTRATLAANGRGSVRARGVGCVAPSGREPYGATADSGRLSPLPLGRWWPAVTPTFGTAPGRSVRLTRPTVPTILSPCNDHSRGRSLRSRLRRAQRARPPLTLIFHGKPIGTYQVGRNSVAAGQRPRNGHGLFPVAPVDASVDVLAADEVPGR
jgi:hypothetical protein